MKKENNNVVDLSIDLIDQHPRNPHKKTQEEVNQLMASIAVNGQHMPITVTQRQDGRFNAVAGNTRSIACKALGHTTIKAIVVEFENETAELEYMLVSNEAHKKTYAEIAREMRLWEEIYGNKQGHRTDLASSEAWNTRAQLAKQYDMSESNVGKLLHMVGHNPGVLDIIDKYNLSIEGGIQLTNVVAEKRIPLDDETLFIAQIIDLVDVGMFERVRSNELTLNKAFRQAVANLGKLRKTEKRGKIRPEKEVPLQSPKKSTHSVLEAPLVDSDDETDDTDEAESSNEVGDEQGSKESNDVVANAYENYRTTIDGAVFCEHEGCKHFGKRIG